MLDKVNGKCSNQCSNTSHFTQIVPVCTTTTHITQYFSIKVHSYHIIEVIDFLIKKITRL